MKKTVILSVIAGALLLCSCEEFQPVFGLGMQEPQDEPAFVLPDGADVMSIKALKAIYTDKPVDLTEEKWIKGQVVSEDRSGNIYRSMYIDDGTAGIEIKVGRSALSNDYKLGQWVYVYLNGLTIGAYGGGVQIGLKDESGQYDTAYMGSPYYISKHIKRGELGTPLEPIKLTGDQIKDAQYFSRYVEVQNCSYGNQVFTIVYGDASHNTKTYVGAANKTGGITTWSYTQEKCKFYIERDGFEGYIPSNQRDQYIENASASSGVSQYFSVPGTKSYLQVRTSGYSKFADTEIPSTVLKKTSNVTFRGILTTYNGNIQFTLLDLEGVINPSTGESYYTQKSVQD